MSEWVGGWVGGSDSSILWSAVMDDNHQATSYLGGLGSRDEFIIDKQ